MESGRRRGHSFHHEYDVDNQTGEVDEKDIASLSQDIEAYDPTACADMGNFEDEEEVSDEEYYSRGRRRSSSVHENDAPKSMSIVPQAKLHPTVIEPPVERTGPLQQREVLALQQGLDEATLHKKDADLEEEEAELRAAELEKAERAQPNNAPVQIGSDPPMRRIKILMLGDSGVGKTSIIYRITHKEFKTNLVGTIGVDFKSVKVHLDNDHIQAQIWDTAGSEQFHKITTSYYRGANGIMLVYDITNPESLHRIDYWIQNIQAHASELVHISLIGNKIDLRDSVEGCVSYKDAKAVASKYSIPYYETSALTADNLESSFHDILRQCMVLDRQNSLSRQKSTSKSPLMAGRRSSKSPITDHKSNRNSLDEDKKCIIS